MRNVLYAAITAVLTITALTPAATFVVGAKRFLDRPRTKSTFAYALVSPPPPMANNDGHEEEHVEHADVEPEVPLLETPLEMGRPAPSRKLAKPAAVATAAADEPGPPPIDTDILRGALDLRVETLPLCVRGDGPSGPGTAEIVFASDGTAQVELSEPYARTATGACVTRRLTSAARAFTGPPVAVRVAFTL